MLGYGVSRPWSRGPRVAVELVSGQPSWPLAFPLFSLMPVLSAPWLAYLSSLTETTRLEEPSFCTVESD